jgi:hypothetical protein
LARALAGSGRRRVRVHVDGNNGGCAGPTGRERLDAGAGPEIGDHLAGEVERIDERSEEQRRAMEARIVNGLPDHELETGSARAACRVASTACNSRARAARAR